MKKILLAGSALVGVAMLAAPAQAELKLGLGGHFSGYAVYVDDEPTGANFESFAIRRNTEIHFTGETTLDNGLTVGFHTEQRVDGNAFSGGLSFNNESYAYFSGGWGRVNLGNEDGAAYLLQVAAPSADSNVDGLRSTIQGFTYNYGALDYDLAHFGNGPEETTFATSTDRITYLTPKFNGFQAGVSYAPNVELAGGIQGMNYGGVGFEDAWEIAARWDGQFEGVGISVGAGYSTVDNRTAGAAEPNGWNVGFNLAWNQFAFGAVYLDEEDTIELNSDVKTWVVGASWDNGPWHAGASYLNREDDPAGPTSFDSYKATLGGGYTFGPGMTFRGALSFGEALFGVTENDFTQVTIGTDIRF